MAKVHNEVVRNTFGTSKRASTLKLKNVKTSLMHFFTDKGLSVLKEDVSEKVRVTMYSHKQKKCDIEVRKMNVLADMLLSLAHHSAFRSKCGPCK